MTSSTAMLMTPVSTIILSVMETQLMGVVMLMMKPTVLLDLRLDVNHQSLLAVMVPVYHLSLCVMVPETVWMVVMRLMPTVPLSAPARRNNACQGQRNVSPKSFGVMVIRTVRMGLMRKVVL